MSPPAPDRDPAWLALIASRQCGLVTIAQHRRAGIADDVRLRRVRQGKWRRLAPKVVIVDSGAPSRRQLAMAAVLHAGPGALVTGFTALELANVPHVRYPRDVHVLVAHTSKVERLPGMRYERTSRLPEAQRLRVPPTAPYARAVVDACRAAVDEEHARSAALAAVQRRLCDVESLRAECAQAARRNRRRLDAVLDEVGAGVRSLPEGELRRAVLASELREPLWNPRVYMADGAFLCSPDGLWEEEGVAVEVDSATHHAFGADRLRTAERAQRTQAAGLMVVSVLPRQLRSDPARVIRTLRAILAGPRRVCLDAPSLIVQRAR
ncbi:hypothetical protein [Yinghuangia sp. YIM S10712]|uniref:hypothetical protein n=1 Tax=Yinghuangia sp. YIM S10712 TaxID=3436930 RepID=UPI003F52E407